MSIAITITLDEIPDYLHKSELYRNIESNDPFDIHEQYFKRELLINDFNDFVSYLVIFDYWILDKYPKEIYKFIIDNKNKINMDSLQDYFHMDDLMKEIKSIIDTPDDKLCSYFYSIQNFEYFKYVHENGYKLPDNMCQIATENGHFEYLQYAHENGYKLHD